jgi:hypothetical protein
VRRPFAPSGPVPEPGGRQTRGPPAGRRSSRSRPGERVVRSGSRLVRFRHGLAALQARVLEGLPTDLFRDSARNGGSNPEAGMRSSVDVGLRCEASDHRRGEMRVLRGARRRTPRSSRARRSTTADGCDARRPLHGAGRRRGRRTRGRPARGVGRTRPLPVYGVSRRAGNRRGIRGVVAERGEVGNDPARWTRGQRTGNGQRVRRLRRSEAPARRRPHPSHPRPHVACDVRRSPTRRRARRHRSGRAG